MKKRGSMKIGIDFGTTYTKIAYLQEDQLRLFRFPGPQGKEYIPTAIAYYQGRDGKREISIGEAALLDALHRPNAWLATRFKLFLPIRNPEEQRAKGWKLDRSPDEALKDYFEYLLRISSYSFERQIGPIESMVVSVPEVWQRTANNPGAEALRRILVEELKLPVDHLRSEPVCAAAYYVYEYKRRERRGPERPFNLLVCDMGGGTFDVALCRVQGQQVEVLDFDGNSEGGWGLAGAQFDCSLVRAVYRDVESSDPSEENLLELVQEFEQVKIQHHDEASTELSDLFKLNDPKLDDTPLDYYTFRRKYTPTLGHVRQSFAPIAEGIRQVLGRIQSRANQKGWSIDRVAIVGGFGQFPLVQQTIKECLGIQDPTDVRFDQLLHTQHRLFYAIAYGAALVASGQIQPVEYYPHTIGVFVLQREGGIFKERFLPIIKAGKVPAGQLRPVYAPTPVRVLSGEAIASPPIGLQIRGEGEPIRLGFLPIRFPPSGRYLIGIQIDRSNMGILFLQPVNEKGKPEGEAIEYRLGDVNPILMAEADHG